MPVVAAEIGEQEVEAAERRACGKSNFDISANSDGTFYPVRENNGSIDQTIRISLGRSYTFVARNNPGYAANAF